MLFWLEQIIQERINSAGNHVVTVPAANDTRPDTYDIYDGYRKEFIATNINEKYAERFVKVWNYLIDNGLTSEKPNPLNLAWIFDAEMKGHSEPEHKLFKSSVC